MAGAAQGDEGLRNLVKARPRRGQLATPPAPELVVDRIGRALIRARAAGREWRSSTNLKVKLTYASLGTTRARAVELPKSLFPSPP